MKKSTITKFFDVLSSKIYCCLRPKNTVSKLDFLKFNDGNPINYMPNVWLRCWRQAFLLPFVLTAILLTGYAAEAQSIQGVVPVKTPLLGSGVDGDAYAHTPAGYTNVGDLFDAVHPSGTHGVLDLTTGNLLYPGFTFFLQDPWGGDRIDPTIFTQSNKINDDPSTYTWGAGQNPNKNEIQNAGAHFSYGDPNIQTVVNGVPLVVNGVPVMGDPNDLWVLFAGDRQVTNGSSYIDFEFLQKSLTLTGAVYGAFNPQTGTSPIISGSGSFLSAGTDGGRTIGDILVTIEFVQGGGDANASIRVWTQISPGVYEYVLHPNSDFLGNIFITQNTTITHVPFDVFGSDPNRTGSGGDYQVNQWAEGAVNLTQVFNAVNNDCFGLSTLFIRTRSAGNSNQSELKDFPGAPIQLKLCSDKTPPVISALPAATTVECSAVLSFATPTVTDNCSTKPLVFVDVTTPGNCAGNYSVTRRWTATDDCGNTSTATQTISVRDAVAPVITASGTPA